MPSVAPKERVNITYKPATGDFPQGVELPLKFLAVGDFTGRPDETLVEDRKPTNINGVTFNDVMKAHKLEVAMTVPDRLSGEEGSKLDIKLQFKSLKDFEPEGIADQVGAMRKLLELRNALSALKGPLGNFPKFRKAIQTAIEDAGQRKALLHELGIESSGN